MKRYIGQGIDRSRLVYFNFEDERLAKLTVKVLHWITDEYFAMFPENRPGKVYFFFDENPRQSKETAGDPEVSGYSINYQS